MKAADNDQQWKRKYYNSLEELEQKEQSWQELENLLRSLTIRMSLAIDGLDKSMDRQLDSLRSTLRKKPGKDELLKVINGITNALDQLDKLKVDASHKEEHEASSHGWQVMLQILRDLDLPKEYHPRYQSLQNSLLKCNEQTEVQPYIHEFHTLLLDIIKDYRHLQETKDSKTASDNLAVPVDVEPDGKKQGILGRLFNKDKEHSGDKIDAKLPSEKKPPLEHQAQEKINTQKTENPDVSEGGHKETELPHNLDLGEDHSSPDLNLCQSGIDVISVLTNRLTPGGHTGVQVKAIASKARNIHNGQKLLELASDLANSLNQLWSDEEHGDLSHASNINEILLQLLDRLSLPLDCQQKVVLLQTRLEAEVKEDEWPELLDEIASLVGSIRKKVQEEKKDLEKYLSHLTDRLQAIDNSLQGVKQDQKNTYDSTLQLNNLVSEQVQELRNAVQDTSDFDVLKTSVEKRIDAITDHMERFRVIELQRDKKSRDRIGELTERLSIMEKETVELRSKVIKQRKMAMLDRLTGLPNRSAYDDRLDQEYRRWRRFHDHLCMVVIDVDLFKNVNDNYGHKAGDKVLATIAAVLKDKVRETDFVARYGGEEFVALVTGAKLEDAVAVADKLRAGVESCGFHFRGKRVPITISAGIAEFCENDTPDDVFDRADKAMYDAKEAGRNQCVSAAPCVIKANNKNI